MACRAAPLVMLASSKAILAAVCIPQRWAYSAKVKGAVASGVGVGVGCGVGVGVGVGTGVGVGNGVAVGTGVGVGCGVAVAAGVAVNAGPDAAGVAVSFPPPQASRKAASSARKSGGMVDSWDIAMFP